jgi:hypothetical protein
VRLLTPMLFLAATAFGQTSDVPYAPNSDGPGPTFHSADLNISFPGSYASIREVDFRNLRTGRYQLRNGTYKHDDRGEHLSVQVDSVHYLDDSSSGGAALVLYSWFAAGGSSSQGGTAKLFLVSGRQLRCIQAIEWDTHFDAGQRTESFDPKQNTLVIRSAHYIPGDAHCCVSGMDVVTYAWNDSRFTPSRIETELSAYGKAQGKVLPR